MSLNASKRNLQRPPSSSVMDKSTHAKISSNKIVNDSCVGSKNALTNLQTLPQKTSGMPPPSRVTKQVRNPIPIRHTLTSKLRMEKANPLLTSSCVPGISEPSITRTPSRRSTFHPAIDSKKTEKKPVFSTVQNSQSKKLNTPAKKQLKSILRKSASIGDFRNVNMKITDDTGVLGEIENPSGSKALNKSLKSVAFYSPLHNSSYTPVNITNTPTPSVLRKRLEDWLVKRGKSSFSYRHLCCFGLPKNAQIVPPKMNCNREIRFNETESGARDDHNNAEPCLNETITLESSESHLSFEKNHENEIEKSAPKGSSTPEHEMEYCDENKENDAYLSHPEALDDLRKLVHSGYPRDQCEDWLSLISKTHPTVKEIPQYWECLAALEEARGDFSSAVDCYGRAIVKGADADDVDECLDDLWEKFCTLSVSSVENKRTSTKKLAIDTKQIFKSTVIKFALQQKAVKRSNKSTDVSMQNVNYIVTPVRRSSRRSTSRFRTTPTMKCVNKLEDLEQNIRETMEFHGNAVLNPGI